MLELLGVAAAVVTGDWSLTWFVPYFIVVIFLFTFIRLLLIAFFFFPVLAAVIVVWAAYTLFKKQKKKANLGASTRGPTTPSEPPQ